jgi:carboxymethylenebutenolidase
VDAIGIDYFGRTAGIGDRGPGFDWASHVPRTTYEDLRADVTAAVGHLRATTGASRIFTMGFCMGGRLAFLTDGFGLGLAGVIGFYGWPVGPSRNGTPAPAEVADTFEAPVLAIFGGADEGIGSDAVTTFEQALEAAGVEHRVVTYPGAPHSFFDRKHEEFAEISAAAWDEVLAFTGLSVESV